MGRLGDFLNRRFSFRQALWFIPVQIAIHSLEEAVTMPRWVSEHLPAVQTKISFPLPVETSPFEILMGLLIVTILPSLLAYLCAGGEKKSLKVHLLIGLQAIMLVNAIIPHIGGAILLRAYVPGVATAALINFPFSVYLFRRAFREEYVGGTSFVYAFLAAAILYLPGVLLIHKLAGSMAKVM